MNEELKNKLEELNQKIDSLKIDINELRKEFKTDVANFKTMNIDVLNVNDIHKASKDMLEKVKGSLATSQLEKCIA